MLLYVQNDNEKLGKLRFLNAAQRRKLFKATRITVKY